MGALPRVAGHTRNPGLCNRNSYRVAGGAYQPIEAPSQPSPGGRSATQTPSNTASRDSRPLGRAGEGHLGNSVGVAISRRRYPNATPSPPICRGIIQLSITPTAKRNSYRVAILVGALPRVAGHARNPGLCNRNSVRVTWGAYQPIEAPSQPSPGGRSATQTPSNTASRDSRPLGRAGEGLPTTTLFVPANSRTFFTANGGFLILLLFSLPIGRRGSGCWQISESGLSGISANTRRRIGRSPEKEQNFLYYSRVLP